MAFGRPVSNDSPDKYRESYELFTLTRDPSSPLATVAEEVASFLEWAISEGESGFAEGDIISIGALAGGLGKSRNTAAKSVEQLVAKGMVARPKLKSPYQIISRQPIFKDTRLVADEQISLTGKVESESTFGPARTMDFPDPTDPLSGFLSEELAASRDTLILEAAAKNWQEGRLAWYQRVRTTERADGLVAYLSEITYLQLDDDQAERFHDRFTKLRDKGVTRFSMYSVLEQCGLPDLRAGRTQVSVGTPPAILGQGLRDLANGAQINLDPYLSAEPLLKWTYALFRPDVNPMVTFSVCYVRTDMLGIFIRALDVEPA
jgi:hypothetical protein